MIFYRPHETWTRRADWRTELPEGESVRCEYILLYLQNSLADSKQHWH